MFRKLITGSLLGALLAGTASADTLREALVSAYHSNPTLTAQREALQGDRRDRGDRQGRRPAAGQRHRRPQPGPDPHRHPRRQRPQLSVGVDVSYPLFSGGSVRNQVKAAETRVEAGRATLRAVEGDVFTKAVSAYMDVIRDRAIVELNQNNVKVLETNLEATRDRFEIGDLTRTDVAQSEARLQLGRSQLATAEGQLTSSEATYRQVIGHTPGSTGAAAAASAASRVARRSGADRAGQQPRPDRDRPSATAAGYDVSVARASRLPTVSAVGSGSYVNASRRSRHKFWPVNAGSTAPTGLASMPGSRSSRAAFPLPDPAGAGDRGPDAGAGRRHRTRCRRRPRARLRELRGAQRGDPVQHRRGPGERAGAGRRPRRADGRHPHRPRRPQRRAGTAELAGDCSSPPSATPMSPASSC